jgi:predicted nucleic acid-binding protein
MIILDSSPLIHLTKIGKINYIIDLFDGIIISRAVCNEVIKKGQIAGYSDAVLLKNYIKNNRIKVLEVKTPDPILQEYLHPGEYESIQLALELDSLLIMDEKKGRNITEQKRIETLTTADIILLLLKEKSINFKLFRQNLSKYAADGWLGANIYQKYLREGKNYE